MDNQHANGADQYLTRRQLREARARQQEQSPLGGRDSLAGSDSQSDTNPLTDTDPVLVLSNLATETGEVFVTPGVRRRDLREQAGVGQGLPQVKRRRAAGYGAWLPRAGAVGALALATIAVPLAPNLLPAHEQGEPAPLIAATESSLGALAAAEQLFGESEVPVTLQEDFNADARSAAVVSRYGDRDEIACEPGTSAANGALAAATTITPAEVVEPLTEGSYRISSKYGPRYIFGRYSNHLGLDFAAPAGTAIHSVANGVVEYVGGGKNGRSGMLIIIRHEIGGQVYRTWYGHMYPGGVYATTGQEVLAGQVIGAVGSYGNSTGPHLHFEVHVDGNLTTMNPQTWLANVGAEPLNSETILCG